MSTKLVKEESRMSAAGVFSRASFAEMGPPRD